MFRLPQIAPKSFCTQNVGMDLNFHKKKVLCNLLLSDPSYKLQTKFSLFLGHPVDKMIKKYKELSDGQSILDNNVIDMFITLFKNMTWLHTVCQSPS